jgi:hypothetical protein
MAHECKMLPFCGFLKKHGSDNDLAGLWFRSEYCAGEKQEECKRKEYMIEQGKMPPDDMAPTGDILAPAGST